MKRRSGSRNRAAQQLSESLHRRLNAYALAASAAGVGVIAMVQSASGKIIYTPAHEQIVPNNIYPLDLNHDGKTDFSFHDSFTAASIEGFVGAITVIPARRANKIVGYDATSFLKWASALPAGVRIGPKGPFSSGSKVMVSGYIDTGTTTVGQCGGPWKNARHRYLGLKFTIDGETHYGWARLNETCAKNGENTALLTGYAYETVPNKAIITGKTHGEDDIDRGSGASLTNPIPDPQPASLGALALGAPGLSIWRRKESVALPH